MKDDLYQHVVEKADKMFGGAKTATTGKIESADFYQTKEFNDYFIDLYESVKSGMATIRDSLSAHENKLDENVARRYSSDFITPIAFINISHWLFERSKSPESKQAIADFYFSKN